MPGTEKLIASSVPLMAKILPSSYGRLSKLKISVMACLPFLPLFQQQNWYTIKTALGIRSCLIQASLLGTFSQRTQMKLIVPLLVVKSMSKDAPLFTVTPQD